MSPDRGEGTTDEEQPERPGPKRSADDRTQQDAGLDGGGAAAAQDGEERVGADEDEDEDESD